MPGQSSKSWRSKSWRRSTSGCATSMSFLTGQSKDHGKASCEQPGDEEAGGPTTNCWEAKTFSFPVDFFPNQSQLIGTFGFPFHQNEERLAGQVAHSLKAALQSTGKLNWRRRMTHPRQESN